MHHIAARSWWKCNCLQVARFWFKKLFSHHPGPEVLFRHLLSYITGFFQVSYIRLKALLTSGVQFFSDQISKCEILALQFAIREAPLFSKVEHFNGFVSISQIFLPHDLCFRYSEKLQIRNFFFNECWYRK